MKITFIIIALLIYSGQLISQGLSKDSLIATWKVVECQVLPIMEMKPDSEGMKRVELFRKGMIDTKFNFGSNAIFTIEIPKTASTISQELKFLNNKSWMLTKDVIKVGVKENLMNIIARELDNKIYFLLDDSPFLLEVIKL